MTPYPKQDYDPLLPRLTVPWWVIGIVGSAFILLGLICQGGSSLAVDLDVSHWVQNRSSAWADAIARVGNTIGEAPVTIGLLIVATALGTALKRWRELWFLLVVAIGRLLGTSLKGFFDSPRPNGEQVHLQEIFDGYGFPSGHTLTSTLVAGTLAFLLARQSRSGLVHGIMGVAWVIAVGMTAFARIWVGAHWFTDTVGSALVGVFILLLAANLSLILVLHWPGSSRSESTPYG